MLEIKNIEINTIKYENSPVFTLFYADFDKSVPKTDVLLAFYLKHYFDININKNDFEYSPNGKPYLKANTLYFSSSNKNSKSLIVISSENVGIDMEYIDRTKNIKQALKKIFTVDEYNSVFQGNNIDIYEKFYQIWTKKESYLKLKGLKLSDISKIDISNQNIQSFKKGDYIVSIAF